MHITTRIKKLSLPFLAFAAALSVSMVFVAAPAYAQTQGEADACRAKWNNENLGVQTSTKYKNYANSDCDKSDKGNCTRTATRDVDKSTVYSVKCDKEPYKDTGGGGGGGATNNGCGDIETTVIDCTNNGGNPVISMLLQIINFMAVGVGIAVVGGIIWGGLMYAASNGDAGKAKEGRTIIINAVIGLLLFFFMYAIVNFLVPGGVFT